MKHTHLDELEPAFRYQLSDFRKRILANSAVKILFKKALSGRNLADFAEELLQQKIPVLKSAYVNIRQKELYEDLGVT